VTSRKQVDAMKNTRALNPKNERVKREYLHFLKHAQGQNEQSLEDEQKEISKENQKNNSALSA